MARWSLGRRVEADAGVFVTGVRQRGHFVGGHSEGRQDVYAAACGWSAITGSARAGLWGMLRLRRTWLTEPESVPGLHQETSAGRRVPLIETSAASGIRS